MNIFKTARGNEGIAERINEAARSGQSDGWEGVADWALNRYDTRVRARLRIMGLDVPDSGPLTVQTLKDVVRAKSGLDIEDLTPEGVSLALDKRLAAELSRELGFEVSTVFNTDSLRIEVKSGVMAALDAGRGGPLHGDTLEDLRAVATFVRAGLVGDDRRKALNRYKQKKYRRNNKQIWE